MPTLNINGKDTAVNADDSTPILWALRDTLGMTGTKFGCGQALCGACTVHLNGAQFMLKPPRPPHWGGYRLKPDQWEFWQGRKSRLHDRLRYRLDGTDWVRERLAP